MNDRSFPLLAPPVLRGYSEHAAYGDPRIPDYRGNPLIEALPPIWAGDAVARRLMRYPDYDEAQRSWPSELRFHLIRNAVNFFEPLPIHLDLEQRFSCMMRMGYQARNPVKPGFWSAIEAGVTSIASSQVRTGPGCINSTAFGFAIIGISGIGKTTAVEGILSLYPQVIYHSQYGQRDFNRVQVVWLKLDCPFDGSVKGLCLNFFQAIDSLLDTRYYLSYARHGRATVDEMLPQMARLASIHSLGVLVIDEMQHLSEARSGGSSKMLNFFVQLVNTIGMPVVLIGTYKALPLLRGEFRQARRGTGQGDLFWDRMDNDHLWRYFVESLWRYQYVREASPLTDKLSDALYDATQGITDFAVKVYMLAQVRAIVAGLERVTAAVIRSVTDDSLRLAAPVLDALRRRDIHALRLVEDVYIDLNRLVARETALPATEVPVRVASPNEQEKTPVDVPAVTTKPGGQHHLRNKPREHNRETAAVRDGLLAATPSAVPGEATVYEALQRAGYIRRAVEFLSAEVQP